MRWIMAFFALLMACSWGQSVATWNIHRGVGMDEKLDLARIAKVIESMSVDAIVLQEVDQGTQRSGKVKQAEELARLLGWKVFFGKAMDFQGGEYGQAILSPWPLQNAHVWVLSQQGEPRVAVAAEVRAPHGAFHVVGLHLDAGDASRRQAEWKVLERNLASLQGPICVMGDWNESPQDGLARSVEKAGFTMVKKHGVPESWPANKPSEEIDHIWIRNWQVAGKKCHAKVVDESVASDHRPVLMKWQ